MAEEKMMARPAAVIGMDMGDVTEMGVEWDSPAAEAMWLRLGDQINRYTEKVMAGACAGDYAARERRAREETAEMQRQADVIYNKHTRQYAKVRDNPGGADGA